MNNIVTNFNQILNFSKQMGIPIVKKRAIIREYLQTKFIVTLYSLPLSEKLSFVGGTSLRLLRNLPRFSEDLDFDNLGLSNKQIAKLVENVIKKFESEGFEIEAKINLKDEKSYFDLRFPNLLSELKISTNPREKLMIKFDYANFWKNQNTELILINKYGFIENIVTNTINQIMIQKLTAYLHRKNTQPRDIYDVVWLYSQGARPDFAFAKLNNLTKLLKSVEEKLATEGIQNHLKTRLLPFLFNEDDVKKLDLFKNILDEMLKDK